MGVFSCVCSCALRGCGAFWECGVLECGATHTTQRPVLFVCLPLGPGSWVLGLGSRVFGSSWPISRSCALLVMGPAMAQARFSLDVFVTSAAWHSHNKRPSMALHHALRRMADLVFLLVFCLGASGRFPKARRGRFLLCNSSSSNKRPSRALWSGRSPRPTAVPCLPLGRLVPPPLAGWAVAVFF